MHTRLHIFLGLEYFSVRGLREMHNKKKNNGKNKKIDLPKGLLVYKFFYL